MNGLNDSLEEGTTKDDFQSMESAASDGPLSKAEQVLTALDSGLVVGPYEPDPVNQKDDVGY